MEEHGTVASYGKTGASRADRLTRRGFLKAGALALAPLLLPGTGASRPDSDTPPILWHGSRTLPLLAVTIDDCYSLPAVQRLAQVLSGHPEMKATFFPTGRALVNTAEGDPELWPRLRAQGHEFGYHGYEHEAPSRMSAAQIQADLGRWQATLADVAGDTPVIHFARPPYGDYSYSFREFCQAEQLTLAMWSTDWGGARTTAMRRVGRARAGDIVLMHGRFPDAENLEPALAAISDLRLCKVTLSELQSACGGVFPGGKVAVCECGNEPKESTGKSLMTPGDA
ncbi:MAG: hypothetical protein A2Y93_12430 [Chloroflexi bacterium RBG_13_68_17]|nr:MAG: hypothetical protein A2Y93_12430 [Chloroflexi bacterium RBG_13_68_17]